MSIDRVNFSVAAKSKRFGRTIYRYSIYV